MSTTIPGDPNYDLFKLSCKVSLPSACSPNYVFLDAPFNLQYYKPGHPETEVATMGCRTRVMGNVYDPHAADRLLPGQPVLHLHQPAPAGHREPRRRNAVLQKAGQSMLELVAQQLLDRFEIQASKHVYNYPFLMGQGVWLDSDKLLPPG